MGPVKMKGMNEYKENILLIDSSSHSGQYDHCIATHSAVLKPCDKNNLHITL
jgi:hypothetical protein